MSTCDDGVPREVLVLDRHLLLYQPLLTDKFFSLCKMSRAFGTPSTVTLNNPDLSCVALNNLINDGPVDGALSVLLRTVLLRSHTLWELLTFTEAVRLCNYNLIVQLFKSSCSSSTLVLLPFKNVWPQYFNSGEDKFKVLHIDLSQLQFKKKGKNKHFPNKEQSSHHFLVHSIQHNLNSPAAKPN